jgi:hypothetical protein
MWAGMFFEGGDLLRVTVFGDSEVLLMEALDRPAVFAGDDDVDDDGAGVHGEYGCVGGWGLGYWGLGKSLSRSNKRACENEETHMEEAHSEEGRGPQREGSTEMIHAGATFRRIADEMPLFRYRSKIENYHIDAG